MVTHATRHDSTIDDTNSPETDRPLKRNLDCVTLAAGGALSLDATNPVLKGTTGVHLPKDATLVNVVAQTVDDGALIAGGFVLPDEKFDSLQPALQAMRDKRDGFNPQMLTVDNWPLNQVEPERNNSTPSPTGNQPTAASIRSPPPISPPPPRPSSRRYLLH